MSLFKWLLENILTLNPITSISTLGLIILYTVYTLFTILAISPFFFLDRKRKSESKIKISLSNLLVGVPVEDFMFRFLPLWLFGQWAAVYAHLIWAMMHRPIPNIIFAFVHGLLDLRLWLGGLWVEAVVLHVCHDLLCLAMVSSIKKAEKG